MKSILEKRVQKGSKQNKAGIVSLIALHTWEKIWALISQCRQV